jgi:hypothetical protein
VISYKGTIEEDGGRREGGGIRGGGCDVWIGEEGEGKESSFSFLLSSLSVPSTSKPETGSDEEEEEEDEDKDDNGDDEGDINGIEGSKEVWSVSEGVMEGKGD